MTGVRNLFGSIALPLFDGGARNAQLRSAIKNFEVTVAAYRNTVLTGFLEVEDALAELHLLAQAIEAQQHAVELTMNQYQAGTVSYLNVMTAQATALTNEETEVELQGRSLLAVVHLVKALGGGWDAKETVKVFMWERL
ncbi:MAG: TolC family protein [Methylovulum sp.]|nr:TolC family protein [Methylovulum sp.]